MTDEKTNDRSRWMALYVLCAGVLMIVIDATIVNVALPSIQEDLGFSQSNLAWVVNAYLIAFGGLLLLAGRIGDLIGQRRIFLIGLAVFTAASLLCAVAQTQEMLIAARFVQGVGGALASAVILGMIVTMFPEPREQAKAIGVYGFVASAGGSIGLLAGGALTEAISWHWIFFVNVPIGVATAPAGAATGRGSRRPGPEGRRRRPRRCAADQRADARRLHDPAGLRAGLDVDPDAWARRGLDRPGGGVRGAPGADPQPADAAAAVPLAAVAGANAIQALLVMGLFGMFFLGALYMQQILGYTPLEVGLAFLPATIVMGLMSLRFSGPLIMRFGARTPLIAALVSIGAGLLLFTRTPVDGSYVTDIGPAMILIGIGGGLGFPSLMGLAMSGATPSDSGLASGLVNTSVQVGGAIGLAVLATLANGRTDALLADGVSSASALNGGFHLAYLIGAALIGVAIVLAVSVLPRPPRAAEAEAEHHGARPHAEVAFAEGG